MIDSQIEVASADKSIKTTLEDDDTIVTEESISIDNKKG